MPKCFNFEIFVLYTCSHYLILAFYEIRGILGRNYKIYTPWLFTNFPFSCYDQIENIITFQNIYRIKCINA